MTTIFLQRVGNALLPYDERAVAFIAKIPMANFVQIDAKKVRSPQFHKRAFALMHQMFDMQDEFIAFEPFRYWLTIKAGYIDFQIVRPDGTTVVKPQSLAYASMPEYRFERWWNDVVQVFIDEFGLDITQEELAEVVRY